MFTRNMSECPTEEEISWEWITLNACITIRKATPFSCDDFYEKTLISVIPKDYLFPKYEKGYFQEIDYRLIEKFASTWDIPDWSVINDPSQKNYQDLARALTNTLLGTKETLRRRKTPLPLAVKLERTPITTLFPPEHFLHIVADPPFYCFSSHFISQEELEFNRRNGIKP
jgi:hypothetical protein